MNRRSWFGVAMLLVGSAAASQPATMKPKEEQGSRLRSRPIKQSSTTARQVTAAFAQCVVDKHPGEAARYLAATTSKEAGALIPKVFDEDCLTGEAEVRNSDVQLAIPPSVAKFALAEALIKAQPIPPDPPVLVTAGPIAYRSLDLTEFLPENAVHPSAKQLASAEEARIKAEAEQAFERFGECVVRANPAAVPRLLATPVASSAEAQVLNEIMPQLSACLEKGAQFSATKGMMRGTLALAYYRLSHAPSSPAATQAQAFSGGDTK